MGQTKETFAALKQTTDTITKLATFILNDCGFE
uniref:Uncharacterized protein n=1 Tax=Lepeophtheirus salmonis TaxID=72036 RepID=A0A0K2U1C8_LEPSM